MAWSPASGRTQFRIDANKQDMNTGNKTRTPQQSTGGDVVPRATHAYALRITGIYVVLGGAWIVFSDMAVQAFAPAFESAPLLQTAKDLVYIGATALLVYWLARRTLIDTEQHYLQQQLTTTRGHLDRTLDSVGEAVLLVDPNDDTIRQANPAAARVFGYSHEELVGREIRSLLENPDALDPFLDRSAPALAAGEVHQSRYAMRCSEDRRIEAEVTVSPLREDLGWNDGIVIIARDVTPTVQLHEQLRERVKEQRTLYEITKILTDTEFPLDQRLKSIVSLLPPGWRYPEATHARIVFGEQTYTTPGFQHSPWLQSTPIHCFGNPVGRLDVSVTPEPPYDREDPFLAEETTLVEALARGIGEAAERENLERQYLQAQKLESIGRLAGGIAHDFNNALGIVLGHIDLILEDIQEDSPFKTDLTKARNAADHAADLTRQLLVFSRREAAVPDIVDINDTLASIVHMLERIVPEEIQLRWDPAPQPCRVRANAGRLHQVLANLVVNARDAIVNGGSIAIAARRESLDEAACVPLSGARPGEYVCITVTDSGSGIDPDIIEDIFEPFYTTKPTGEGTGLGLATVYGIVSQCDGFIDVASEPNKGSTFSIYLPHAAERAPKPATPAEVQEETGTETVLIVEDNTILLELNHRLVTGLGYTAFTAACPSEAIRIAHQFDGRIELLITDVVMPEMNGHELYLKLREIVPGLKCLYTSGYTPDAIAERGVNQEDTHFLQKPFRRRDLARKIREALA